MTGTYFSSQLNLVYFHFYTSSHNLVLVFPREYKLALRNLHAMLAQDKLTLNDPNSRWLMHCLIFV